MRSQAHSVPASNTVDPLHLEPAIRRLMADDKFWELLIEDSLSRSGPFDGSCLICAKAIIHACNEGSLVRMVCNNDLTQHYGARLRDKIYDFGGEYDSPEDWITRVTEAENMTSMIVRCEEGFDDDSEIPDDTYTQRKVTTMLVKAMRQLEEQYWLSEMDLSDLDSVLPEPMAGAAKVEDHSAEKASSGPQLSR